MGKTKKSTKKWHIKSRKLRKRGLKLHEVMAKKRKIKSKNYVEYSEEEPESDYEHELFIPKNRKNEKKMEVHAFLSEEFSEMDAKEEEEEEEAKKKLLEHEKKDLNAFTAESFSDLKNDITHEYLDPLVAIVRMFDLVCHLHDQA